MGCVNRECYKKLTRAKSLTDDDLEDLKGCLDLGFGFSYDEIPELCNTLPALELCYSMRRRFSDDKNNNKSPESSSVDASPPSPPIANWKISSPGDNPDDVKARLKYWAQAVACTVQLCNSLVAVAVAIAGPVAPIISSATQNQADDGSCSARNSPSPPIANWKISSPGDNPDDVKARLKYWAQAVACTVQLCK
ncbi:hypothetical protein F2Q69_00063770 [Brassica cretica]|uniref:Uncharacterized protein n=1 Tax=Brassica cretica TaxID=69181 RepID=A0A8S9RQN2_BRACR|nr:hypothetical protein F2Q69_00063770 [Brassica cretica]